MNTMKREDFIQATLDYAHVHNLWKEGDRILTAVSGGPDSLGLLLFFIEVAKLEKLTIGCCCVNHHMREEAESETVFVSDVCKEHGIECYIRQAEVPKIAAQTGESLETVGRNLRYKALYEIVDTREYQWIATAHHADDQAETILYHLLRGSGMLGLTGIHPKREQIIRPFLWATKSQIQEFVDTFPYKPCHDITNDMAITTRNHIRLELLPELKKYNVGIVKTLNQTAEIIREEERILTLETDKLVQQCVNKQPRKILMDIKAFNRIPLAFKRRILRRVMQSVIVENQLKGKTISFDGIEVVRDLIEHGSMGQITSHAGVMVYLACGKAEFFCGNTHDGIKEMVFDDSYELHIEEFSKHPTIIGKNQFILDADKVGHIELRQGRNDDIFFPKGMSGRKQLFKCMKDLKIPAEKRKNWPIIADENYVYWIGFLRGSRYGLPDQQTKRYLVLTLRSK
ncbi:MAG: tRNA lysidine(34) synthetase TilS [Dialister pneumosintes]